MRHQTRNRRKLELRSERLRVLGTRDLDRVAGGHYEEPQHNDGRRNSRFCPTTDV